MPQTIKLALLDDYQKVAMRMADWDRLKKRGVEITVFHEPFASVEDAAQKLEPRIPRQIDINNPDVGFVVEVSGETAGAREGRARLGSCSRSCIAGTEVAKETAATRKVKVFRDWVRADPDSEGVALSSAASPQSSVTLWVSVM